MAVGIVHDALQGIACMYDTTTDQAFGPVFSGPSADTEVQEFMDWLRENPPHWAVAVANSGTDGTDPRHYIPSELESAVKFWCDLPTVNTDA